MSQSEEHPPERFIIQFLGLDTVKYDQRTGTVHICGDHARIMLNLRHAYELLDMLNSVLPARQFEREQGEL